MSTVRVSNIPSNKETMDTVHQLFLSFGNILNITQHSSYIDVQFQDIGDAQSAIDNMSGFELFGKFIQVSKAKEISSVDTLEEKKPVWEQVSEFNVE
jgi:RNA recognition motif-containing protein